MDFQLMGSFNFKPTFHFVFFGARLYIINESKNKMSILQIQRTAFHFRLFATFFPSQLLCPSICHPSNEVHHQSQVRERRRQQRLRIEELNRQVKSGISEIIHVQWLACFLITTYFHCVSKLSYIFLYVIVIMTIKILSRTTLTMNWQKIHIGTTAVFIVSAPNL